MAPVEPTRGFGTRLFVTALAVIAVGLPVGVQAIYHPGWQARILIPADSSVEFNGSEFVPVVAVSGSIHVVISGSWTGAGPTWQSWGVGQPFLPPLCFPRCGNASLAGLVSYSADFCSSWPSGGTSYYNGHDLTVYIGFATLTGVTDTVRLHLAVDTSPSSVCG